jgi:DNA-directed RNA polymerase subunit RPC12/RpoP
MYTQIHCLSCGSWFEVTSEERYIECPDCGYAVKYVDTIEENEDE